MSTKVRMNVTIPPDILKRLHAMAEKNHRSLSSMVSLLLAESVARNEKKAEV
jgi:predicted transcriptional regulator